MQRQFIEKKKVLETNKKQAILDKYGGDAKQPIMDPRLKLGQSEAFVEYSRW